MRMPGDTSDLDQYTPGRVTPRECIRAARDALTKAYGCGGSAKCWPFIMEALDWQRRAVEQLAQEALHPGDPGPIEMGKGS